MGTLQQCVLWSGGSLRRGKQVTRSRPIGHRWRDSTHLAWPHLRRFSVTNWRLGRVNPGCGRVGSVTRSCPGGPVMYLICGKGVAMIFVWGEGFCRLPGFSLLGCDITFTRQNAIYDRLTILFGGLGLGFWVVFTLTVTLTLTTTLTLTQP